MSTAAELSGREIPQNYLRAVLLCCGIAAIEGYDIACIGFAIPLLVKEWGLPPSAFTSALSLGSVAMLIGALVCGPLGDKWGRKSVLIGCVVVFGLASLATIFATNSSELVVARVITGFGLGGGIPVAIALITDISPREKQSGLVMIMSAGVPAGSVVGGGIVSLLIAPYGWQAIFLLGGIAPLAYLPALLALPRGGQTSIVSTTDGLQVRRNPVASLFQKGLAPITIILWMIVVLNLLVAYFIIYWMPSILSATGATPQQSILGAIFFQAGGVVGALMLGSFIDKLGTERTLAGMLGLGLVSILVIGLAQLSFAQFVAFTLLAGIGIAGGQLAVNALAGILYPIEIRSTGAGWALGVGRLGNILGPTLGGILFALQWTPQYIVLAAALPVVVAIFLVLALLRQRKAS